MSNTTYYAPKPWELTWGLDGNKDYTLEGLLYRAIENKMERMLEGIEHPIDAVAKFVIEEIEPNNVHDNETVREVIREAVVELSSHYTFHEADELAYQRMNHENSYDLGVKVIEMLKSKHL